MTGIADWMPQVSGTGWRWYAKYLSGNDTLANGSHQAGPYVPKEVVFSLFPTLRASNELNPRVSFPVSIDSASAVDRGVTAIWYNNGVVGGGTRNEARITNWGGAISPILDPEATGALCILAFLQEPGHDAERCRAWICETVEDEELFSDRTQQPLEPGGWLFFEADASGAFTFRDTGGTSCVLQRSEMPRHWLGGFPDAKELVDWAAQRLPLVERSADERLIRRRDCEFELFRSVEKLTVLPRVREGFDSVEAFVAYAGAVANRRKSRSGRSLELHLARIFDEEALPYAHGEISESHKRPDFLFPSVDAYRDRSFPAERLRMLAVKTTCKDRWRQILNEADRISIKHLLTLQEGVSRNQFEEMQAAGVQLVVPLALHRAFPENIRPRLVSLEGFIAGDLRSQGELSLF